MSSVPLSPLPADLLRPLREIRTRIAWLTVARGLFRVFTLLTILLGAALLTDFLFDWGQTARVVWQIGLGAGAIAGVYRYLIHPLRQSLRPEEMAALIDMHYPQLRERLTATIELYDPGIPEAHKGSALMRDKVLEETLRALPKVDPRRSVPTERTKRAAVWGAGSIAALMLPFLFSPGGYSLLWNRLIDPSGNHATVSNLYFEIEDADRVVARGSDLVLQATPQWRFAQGDLPDAVWLHQVDADGDVDRRRLQYDEESGRYVANVPRVFRDFDYHLKTEDSQSESHRITVVDAPEITSFEVHYEPPAYTGLPAKHYGTATGRLTVFERSQLMLQLKFNKPIRSIDFEWQETARSIDLDPNAAVGASPALKQPTVTLSPDATSATVSLAADVEGPYLFRLTDEYGLHNLQDPPRSISILRDQPPTLEVAFDVLEQIDARPSDRIRIGVTARDDVAVGELELHVSIPGVEPQVISAESDRLGISELAYSFDLDLARFALAQGQIVSWRIMAADQREIPGPNIVWTSPSVINIDENATAQDERAVAERQERWKQELEKLRKQLEANAGTVEQVKNDAREKRDQNKPFERDAEIPPLAEQQLELAGKMQTLGNEFAFHPLYGKMTEILQDLAREQLAPLSEQLERAADAELAPKVDQLAANEKGVRDVAAQLAQLQEVFEQLAEIEKDLLELDRLSAQAERLAEDAVELDEHRRELSERLAADPKQAENPEFLEQADRLEQQFDALASDQRELTNALKELLDKRPELINAARQRELDKLKEFAEQARRLAEQQRQTAGQLEAQAEQARAEVQPARDAQQSLLEELERMLAEADRQANAAAVPPIDPLAAQQAREALERGDLAEAAEAQEALQAELDRLAEQLRQNAPLPADPRAALEELARREEALGNQIQQTAEQMDAADEPVTEQQRADNLRPLARQQEALQQAMRQLPLPSEQQEAREAAADQAEEAVQNLLAGEPEAAAQNAEESAEALRELAQQLPENAAEQAQPPQRSDPNQVAQRARELAQEAERLQERTEQLAADPNPQNAENQRNEIRNQQESLQRQVAELPTDIGRLPRQEAMQQLQQADEQLAQQQLAEAAESQGAAAESLEELAQRAEQLARSQQQPQPEGLTPEQLAEQLQQLAERQEAMQQQTNDAAEAQAGTPEQLQQAREQMAQLQQRQEELARESAAMALQAVREEGARSEAAQQAVESARQADRASEQLERGQVAEAAQSAESAAEAAQKAGESAEADRPESELPAQAGEFAERQQELAQEMRQLAESPAFQQASRQMAQQNRGQQAARLAQQFEQAAERLQGEPLNLGQESGQAQQSQASTSQAAENMQQSSQNQGRGQQSQAARQAQQAAEQLQAAADNILPQPVPASPVPGQTGEQVAEAFQNLQAAQRLLEQAAGEPLGQPSPAQGEQPNANAQPSESNSQPGQSQPGQPNGEGRNRPGMPNNPLQQTAQNLQRAAEAMQQASPRGQSPSQPNGQPGSENAQNGQNGDPTGSSLEERRLTDVPADFNDLQQIETELKRMQMRNWGELPGKLQTEIVQSKKKNPNADYAELIKLYFEEIARQQSPK